MGWELYRWDWSQNNRFWSNPGAKLVGRLFFSLFVVYKKNPQNQASKHFRWDGGMETKNFEYWRLALDFGKNVHIWRDVDENNGFGDSLGIKLAGWLFFVSIIYTKNILKIRPQNVPGGMAGWKFCKSEGWCHLFAS